MTKVMVMIDKFSIPLNIINNQSIQYIVFTLVTVIENTTVINILLMAIR